MELKRIDPNMTVDEIMRRWPGTIRLFIKHRMLCVGCPIGVFHTLKDACVAHDLDEDSFSRQLLAEARDDHRTVSRSVFEMAEAPEQ